ncbi:uncharacterized protein [Diabrotica undecimpunctata]|uniref:uncharacterized protein n=1 Tax=Diabrotica undecimpunctata TaxID=50387 RepID=UPI003B637909
MTSHLLALFVTIIFASSCTSAFFLGWGGTKQEQPEKAYYYLRNSVPHSVQHHSLDASRRPIQIPSDHIFPLYNVQDIQLIPCLCPVNKNYQYEDIPQENVFVHPVSKRSPQKN